MENYKRTILVVEDDIEYNNQFKAYCEDAAKALSLKLGINIDIKQALNYDDALKIINDASPNSSSNKTKMTQAKIDFASFDLRLSRNEASPRGMQLLREFRAKNDKSIAIVISGEPNPLYPIEALQRQGVLAYLYKGEAIQGEIFEYTVRVALRYFEVRDGVEQMQKQDEPDPVMLDAAEKEWQRILQEAQQANIDKRQLPSNLEKEFALLRNKLVDDNTGLLKGKLLRMHLMHRVLNQVGWSLLHVRIENFNAFKQEYDSRVKDLLKAIANMLREISLRYSNAEPIVGFFEDASDVPSFLVILKEKGSDLASKFQDEAVEQFNGDRETISSELERIYTKPKIFVAATTIRTNAKQAAEKALKEEYGDTTKHEEERKKLVAQYEHKELLRLVPWLNVDLYSSKDSYFSDIIELNDSLKSTKL